MKKLEEEEEEEEDFTHPMFVDEGHILFIPEIDLPAVEEEVFIYKERKMEKIVEAVFKLRGTEKEIERMKARIACLSAQEEVISMYIKEERKNGKESVK